MTAKRATQKAPSRLTFFDKLVLLLNFMAAGALLIGYLAPTTNPRDNWLIAFFGLAYPPVLLANVIFIVWWLLRRSKWVLLSIICILVGWKVLNNNIGFRMPSTAVEHPDSSVLRVMNYNVHGFRQYGANKDISTKHEIFEIIDHQSPDVIGMEEFYARYRGEYATIDSLKKILKTKQVYYVQFSGNVEEGFGIAMFSKYPIVNKNFIWLGEHTGGNHCLYIDIKKNNKLVRVYAVHLQSIRFDPIDYQYLKDVSKDGKTDVQSSKRIGGKLKHAFMERATQVAKVKENMATCPYPYVIMGDFNDTPSSYAVNEMAKGLKNAFREKGSGLGRTYNGDFPNYQIDYIMASPAFDVLTYGVIRKKLSDHYPVYSDLRLK